MKGRFASLPGALAARARTVRLGPDRVPALLAHHDWVTPAPVMVWLHGRTVRKEIDPGRYLRWLRAGVAVCAVDLPGHGERGLLGWDSPARTLDVVDQMVAEVDGIVEGLADPALGPVFDLNRAGLGGMSAGGMVTLRRLCDEHHFCCAAVEATAGSWAHLYRPRAGHPPVFPPERVAAMDPLRRLAGWRPIPLLALHSLADAVVPVAAIEDFVEALRDRYLAAGADPALIELATWESTGAPQEHSGFGRFSNDAKNRQAEFLRRHLRPAPPASEF